MPTKRELLEEKTVKELRQMARDKSLPGFSTMNKPGLIDLVESNYLKEEIINWPELELEEIGRGESAGEEEEEEVSEGRVPMQEVEIDSRFRVGQDLVSNLLILGAVAAVVVALILVYLGS